MAQVRRLCWARVPVLLLSPQADLAGVPCLCLWERRGLPPGPRTAGLREASDRRFLMREPAQLRTCFFASQAVVPGNFSLFIREDSSLTVHFAGRG